MTGVLVLVLTLAVATVTGLFLRSRSGQMRSSLRPGDAGGEPVRSTGDGGAAGSPGSAAGADVASGIDLRPFGAEPGARGTLVQFSSAFCAPCRATRAMLGEVADLVPGVRHVEIDVADGDAAMGLVRRLDIRRTPTTLVLDPAGREIRRASGVPRRDQVLAALTEAIGGASDVRA